MQHLALLSKARLAAVLSGEQAEAGMASVRSMGAAAVSCGVLAVMVMAATLPGTSAFSFNGAVVGGMQCRQNALGSASCSSSRRPVLRAASWRMDRKDGGAGKVSKPGGGGGVGNKPTPGGAGGAGEQERGGAGVAVLTKPPEVDKVRVVRLYIPHLQPDVFFYLRACAWAASLQIDPVLRIAERGIFSRARTLAVVCDAGR